jgi:hypothetical protein
VSRKLFPVVGVLFAAAMFGPGTLNRAHQSQVASGHGTYTSRTGPTPPRSDTEKDHTKKRPELVKLVPRVHLGPWIASCRFFHRGSWRSAGVNLDLLEPADTQISALASSQSGVLLGEQPVPGGDTWCVDPTRRLQFLIATIPDPVNSQLVLDFDRILEAIQWAAQDAGYFDDQFWIPWDTTPLASSNLDDKNSELMLRQIRESQPGLQIFSSGRGKINQGELFVFLVAETPTLGVNQAQLLSAIEYIQQISKSRSISAEIPILGPAYSGSLASFKDVLISGNRATQSFHVITPSATVEEALDHLRNVPNIRFEQLVHGDAIALSRFLEYAENSLHLKKGEIGILSESGTAYGHVSSETAPLPGSQAGDELHNFRFPRQISVLRNAYPDQPTPEGPANSSPSPILSLNLKQTLGKTDDVPPLSMGELPMSQDAVLQEIATQIRREKIKLVGIAATDIFDTLFLARFLKESSPDVRLFVLSSDLLLIRAAEDYPLQGTLAITNYPLITGSHAWFFPGTSNGSASENSSQTSCQPDLHFSSGQSEATYNAFSALMNNERCMRDYSKTLDGQPRLWISVVSRTGYWPVALLSGSPVKDVFVESNAGFDLKPESPSNGYLLLCGLLSALSAIHICAFWKTRTVQSRAAADGTSGPVALGWLLQYFYLGKSLEARQKAFFFVCASLILATLDYLVFLPVWVGFFFRSDRGWDPGSWYYLLAMLTFALTAGSIQCAIRFHLDSKPLMRKSNEQWVWYGWLVFLSFYFVWSFFVFRRGTDAQFFLYRSFDLAGGTSPVLPYLFVLGALYLWCWTHIRRIFFWEARRALVPCDPLDSAYNSGFKQASEEIDTASSKFSFHSAAGKIFLGTSVIAAILLPYKYIAGFEIPKLAWPPISLYDFLFICTLVLLYAFIFVSLFRFVYLWSALRRILRRLERQPLRHAFDRLPKKYYSWTPLWYSGAARRTFVVLARSLQCLQKLNATCPAELPALQQHVATLKNSLQELFDAESKNQIDLSEKALQVKNNLSATSSYLLNLFLVPFWSRVGDSESKGLETRTKCLTSSESTEVYLRLGRRPEPTTDEACNIELAEEFVALRFIALIRYVGLQLRNLVTFISAAFILSIISLRSYPFLGHRTIGWGLSVIFVVLGAGIVAVFSQMDKDAILSRITDTEPGKLDKEFYLRLISVGALPLLAVLGSQFPQIGKFLFSWVQPAVEALH